MRRIRSRAGCLERDERTVAVLLYPSLCFWNVIEVRDRIFMVTWATVKICSRPQARMTSRAIIVQVE